VPRNQEVIRQWKVLHALEASRHGVGIDALAGSLDVTTRTIRRDLAALQEAGFPLYDERDDEGRVRWRLDGQVLKGLETGFTLAELCALYLSRNLLDAVAGSPFQRDLTHAFARLERMLSPRMRQFLDRLPTVLVGQARSPGPRRHRRRRRHRRGGCSRRRSTAARSTMRYHSVSSGREKDYLVHPVPAGARPGRPLPARLRARVPATSAPSPSTGSPRRRSRSRRSPRGRPIGDDVFANSLGVNTGPAAPVEIEFDARVAPYVRARVWHATQQLQEQPDGGVTLCMDVCHDWALRSWILSWGPFGRVRSPISLAKEIESDLQSAERNYRAD
jgi:predicted DNA-binding transcriptional regulator YafY